MNCKKLYLLCWANSQIHLYVIASSIKIFNRHNVLSCPDSSQPGWFHIERYNNMCVLGLLIFITATAIIAIKCTMIGW